MTYSNIKRWSVSHVRRSGDATVLFIVIALVFGLIIVREVPAFWALDESSHFSRAYQISEGKFLPQKTADGNYGGLVPASVVQLNNVVIKNLTSIVPTPLLKSRDFKYQSLQKSVEAQPLDQSHKVSFNFPGAAAYTPITYVAPSLGILVCRWSDCSIGQSILIARAFSLISFIAVVAYAIWLIRAKKIRWLVFVVALLPMTLFQAASISADGPVLSLALLLFAIAFKAFDEKKLSPFLITLLCIISICLPLIKINYGLLDLVIIPIALAIYKDRKRALIQSIALIACSALITLGWLYIARGAAKMIGTLQATDAATHTFVSARQQTKFILHKPLDFIEVIGRTIVYNEAYWVSTTTGEFALNSVSIPVSASVYAYLIMVCSVFFASTEIIRHKKRALFMGLVSVLAGLSIFGTLYITFTTVGSTTVSGVQGRYFIPLIPFLLVGLASLISMKISMSPKTARLFFSISSFALLALGVIYYGLATY